MNIISNVKNIGLGIVKHRSHDCLGLEIGTAGFVLKSPPHGAGAGAGPRPDSSEQDETER